MFNHKITLLSPKRHCFAPIYHVPGSNNYNSQASRVAFAPHRAPLVGKCDLWKLKNRQKLPYQNALFYVSKHPFRYKHQNRLCTHTIGKKYRVYAHSCWYISTYEHLFEFFSLFFMFNSRKHRNFASSKEKDKAAAKSRQRKHNRQAKPPNTRRGKPETRTASKIS